VEIATLLGLAATAALAGCLDAIAGGGGLITVPALMLAGLDPAAAVATNKLQGTFSTGSSALAFARAGRLDRSLWPLAVVAGAGGLAGAVLLRLVPPTFLTAVMPALLLAVALYFGLSRMPGDADRKQRMSRRAFALGPVLGIGIYDGFFGPGAGSFYLMGLVALLGFGVTRATAGTKLLNLASNASSLGFYIASGLVDWRAGAVMAAGAFLGAQLGSRLALTHGARLIRPLVVLVCCAMAARLALDPANPLRPGLGP
jgi:uncharacterized membrane protein YfcA